MAETEDVARAVLDALSRRRCWDVVQAVCASGLSGMPAGEIAKAIGASLSATSNNLRELEAAGVVVGSRRGRSISYACVPDVIERAGNRLLSLGGAARKVEDRND